jgi:chromosome segregation ATPase
MADLIRLAVQNDIFVALGAHVFLALPFITTFYLPVKQPLSAPAQWQFDLDGATTTSTVTATVWPKPKTLTDKVYETILQTQTATHTITSTATVPKTLYDTVTSEVTSISTSTDRRYITKYTHYPTGSATPVSEPLPLHTARRRIELPAFISSFSLTAFSYILFVTLFLTSAVANLLLWYLDPRVIRLSNQLRTKRDEVTRMEHSRAQVTKRFEAERKTLCDKRDGDIHALKSELNESDDRIGCLEKELETTKQTLASAKKTEQSESSDKLVIETLRQQATDAKAKQKSLADETDQLQQALANADDKLAKADDKYAKLEQNFRNLVKQHQESQSSSGPDDEAPKQRFGAGSGQDSLVQRNQLLKDDLIEADNKHAGLEKNFKVLSLQLRDTAAKLKQIEDEKATDKKTCENTKDQLRQRIAELEDGKANDKKSCEDEKKKLRHKATELEKALDKAKQVQESQSSTTTGTATTQFQFGSATQFQFGSPVDKDLRDQIESLTKKILEKAATTTMLSAEVTALKGQVQSCKAQEQNLTTQVATLTQERDTASGETAAAKSKGEAVWSELQQLKAAESSNDTAAALIAQKEVAITTLQTHNDNLETLKDRLLREGKQEIGQREDVISQLKSDAATSKQTIGDLQQTIRSLQQRITSIETELAAKKREIELFNTRNQNQDQSQQAAIDAESATKIEALKRELQAEKDKYILTVNDLKNKLDFAEREAEKAQKRSDEAIKSRNDRIAAKVAECRRERQLEIDTLKNSQEASTIKSLQAQLDFFQGDNADLKEQGKEGWKNALKRRDDELLKKKKELNDANAKVEHYQRLSHNFRVRWIGLSNNKPYRNGEITYEEAREGLFMGGNSEIKDEMEKILQFNQDWKAEVMRLEDEVKRLWAYNDKAVEAEMDVDDDDDKALDALLIAGFADE